MTSTPTSLIPDNDAARVQALHRYQILDASSEKVLDEVVALTARIFQVSNAMLSIVEESTVLLKAPYNLPAGIERIPRNQSLCSATILQNGTLVFENLAEESAPLVDISLIQQLNLNFYAGHNLSTTNGHNIGSLCLMDGPPRTFSADERRLLATLAGIVMRLLELRIALGANATTSFALWEPVYKAIGGQLARLHSLADTAGSPATMNHEATAIAGIIDQFIVATLKRV